MTPKCIQSSEVQLQQFSYFRESFSIKKEKIKLYTQINNLMKSIRFAFLLFPIFALFLSSCSTSKKMSYSITKNYKPDDRQLYEKIVSLDSLFFDAYNTCSTNIDKYGSFFSENIEFYHDQGGLMTSKQDIINATKKNICGKVTRELVKGSIEVYPIKDFGAIEIGLHKFHNNQEPIGTPSKVGRFMVIWEFRNNDWKIKRVVSLH
jgi:hypothetical protein